MIPGVQVGGQGHSIGSDPGVLQWNGEWQGSSCLVSQLHTEIADGT